MHVAFTHIIPVEFEQAQNKQVAVSLKHGRPKALCEGSGSMEILTEDGGGDKQIERNPNKLFCTLNYIIAVFNYYFN